MQTFTFQSCDSLQTLLGLLKRMDDLYAPALSSRVDLEDYANKLMRHAVVLIAHAGKQAAGLLAIYCNSPDGTAYITLFGVLRTFAGQGLGTQMMEQAMRLCRVNGMSRIRLEVQPHNDRAQAFYQRFGFKQEGTTKYWLLDLPSDHASQMR